MTKMIFHNAHMRSSFRYKIYLDGGGVGKVDIFLPLCTRATVGYTAL